MSIMDIFRSTPAAVPAAPAPAPATSAAPTTPVAPATPVETAAPIDAFNTLWETAPTDPNAPPTNLSTALTPDKVFEIAKGANFAGAISQEHLTAIAAGGDGAVAALQSAINSATQAVFAQSTLATSKLIEKAIADTNAANLAALPGLVKQHSASDSLRTENPALSSPAAAPIIAAVQAQLALKHPTATATQLTAMAKEYLGNFAALVAPAPKVVTPAIAPGETDWSKFLQ